MGPLLVVVFFSSFLPHCSSFFASFGGLAQLGERQDRTLKVRGSNPLPSTNTFKDLVNSFPEWFF